MSMTRAKAALAVVILLALAVAGGCTSGPVGDPTAVPAATSGPGATPTGIGIRGEAFHRRPKRDVIPRRDLQSNDSRLVHFMNPSG